MLKGLILAGGRGKRVGETTNLINKCMVDIAGKPLLENSLNYAISSGVEEIVLVVGYKAEDIINHYGISYEGKRIKYVIQHEQKGLVHAIECSKKTIDGVDFALFLGDELLLEPRHKTMVEAFQNQDIFALCGVVRQPDKRKISRTYAIFQDDNRRIYRLIEKPRQPMNDWMGTGNCLFRNEIFEYLDRTPINQERGEEELPDLIQCAIDEGRRVESFEICAGYTNINSQEDLNELKEWGFIFGQNSK